jgi:hypothetical protein
MGKKETTTKPAKRAAKTAAKEPAANRAAPASLEPAESPALIEKPKRNAKAPAPRTASAAPNPAASRRAGAGTTAKTPSFTQSDIALRAYFISEQRRSTGAAGNEQQDWIEAERQLQAEFSAVLSREESLARHSAPPFACPRLGLAGHAEHPRAD